MELARNLAYIAVVTEIAILLFRRVPDSPYAIIPYVGMLVFILYRVLRRQRKIRIVKSLQSGAQTWRTVEATIEKIEHYNSTPPCYGVFYSYEFEGSYYGGAIAVKAVDCSAELDSELIGHKVQAYANPKAPEQSAVIASSVPLVNCGVLMMSGTVPDSFGDSVADV